MFKLHRDYIGFACLIVLTAFVAACSSTPVPITPTSELIEATSAPTEASPTFTPYPTPSPSETAAPVLADSLRLDQYHPEISYVIPLTVQLATDDSATLFFELDRPSEGALFYWPVDGVSAERKWRILSATDVRHLITLDGLAPGVAYEVVIGLLEASGAYTLPRFLDSGWDSIHFQTYSADSLPLRVGVIGDSGFGEELTYTLLQEMSGYDLDFVLHTGDVVYKIDEDPSPREAFVKKFYLPFEPILKRMPVFPVVGNHDVQGDTEWEGVPYYYHAFPDILDLTIAPYKSVNRREWYAFAFDQIQFVMLNSQQFYTGDLRAEQTAWLAGRLNDERYTTTIVVFHIPPYTSGRHSNDGLVIRSEWQPLFEGAEVKLVLSGHDHNYERLEVNDITYIVSGGGSSRLYPAKQILPQSQSFARLSHFVLLEITQEKIELSAIGLGGEVLDQVTILLSDS